MKPLLRVASFDIHCYALPYERPVRWFDSVESEGLYVMLRVRGAHGECGIAEAPVRPSWSGVSLRSLVAALEDLLLPALQGVDAGDEDAVRAALDRFPENGLAKMLVDNACWSLRAEAAGQPLWQRWGGRPDVELSWCVTRQEPARMAEEAARMVERHGFRALKLKGGQGVERDVEALRRTRDAVGPGVALSMDANCAYRRDETPSYLAAIAGAGAMLAEDPCPLAADDWFSALVSAAPLPVLVDTPCASLRDAGDFLEHGARALSIKAGRIGFTESRRIEQLAKGRGASVAAGLYAESALGSLLSLQFAAALANPVTPAEMSFFLMLEQQVLAEPPQVVGGRVHLPATVDNERLVDWDRVRRHARTVS
jgi:L-alanine-DL-glutamate epimerase-like enolase superfamily enzyme